MLGFPRDNCWQKPSWKENQGFYLPLAMRLRKKRSRKNPRGHPTWWLMVPLNEMKRRNWTFWRFDKPRKWIQMGESFTTEERGENIVKWETGLANLSRRKSSEAKKGVKMWFEPLWRVVFGNKPKFLNCTFPSLKRGRHKKWEKFNLNFYWIVLAWPARFAERVYICSWGLFSQEGNYFRVGWAI